MGVEYFVLLLLSLSTNFVSCWRFDILGIDESQIEIARIAVYGSRAFVAIPRVDNEQRVTLAELPWPENLPTTLSNTKPFPDFNSQNSDDCDKLQSASTLDLDKFGRLYVLDQGSSILGECQPKIIIYDVNTNKMLLKRELQGISVSSQTSLVVDTGKAKSTDVGKVIIGNAGDNNSSLLLYDFNGQGWWKLTVTSGSQVEENIADDDEPKYLSFDQLAIAKSSSILYATSSEARELYSIDLEDLRNMETMLESGIQDYDDVKPIEVPVKYIGNKFGPSSALHVDFRGNLYYLYKEDNVALKCNIAEFSDENTEVLLQNEELLPNVVQIFSGPAYKVWALNSGRNSQASYTVKLKSLRVSIFS